MAANTINPNAKDYDKYDFSGYELTTNDKGGYDWTDSSGNKNSLYDEGKGGLIHSVTGADGTSSNYVYTGTRDNDYISRLNKSAKKAYKAQSKAPKTGITQQGMQNVKASSTSTSSTEPQVIIMIDEEGNPRKVGTTNDPNAKNVLTGKAVANSYEAIANANIGDFWVDKDNNIHVVTDRDIKYSKGVLEGKYGNDNGNDKKYSDDGSGTTSEKGQPRTTTPEENGKGSDERISDELRSTRELLHDPLNYKDNYQAIIDTEGRREVAEDLLSGSEGKEKGLYGIIPAFLMGDYGNYHLPKYKNYKSYYVKDSATGEVLDTEVRNKDELKRLNDNALASFEKYGARLSARADGKFDVVDNDGEVWKTFDDKNDAVKWMHSPYEISDKVAGEQHIISYNGKSMRYDTKEEAEKAKKELAKVTRGDRAKAWAQLLYRLSDSAFTNAVNNASDFAGEGRPLKSLHSQEMNQIMASNNQLYYGNEGGKNDTVRKLMQLADAGMINFNNLTNEQMATVIGAVGKEKASQIINTLKKQELDKFMAMDYWKNWDEDQKNALSAWFAQSGQGPQTDSLIALASGRASPRDFANKWKTETRLALAEKASTLQHLEKEVERIALENKLTSAQADVIKELVGEQLRNAKLSNDRQVQAMISDSADSLAKIIDAVVPF